MSSQSNNSTPTKKNPLHNLIAGGMAGLVESTICHPLDTIKTSMQLQSASASSRLGLLGTGHQIIVQESPLALYRGLNAVYAGIIPKMALRFCSFDMYKNLFAGSHDTSKHTRGVTFMAGLACGVTEAVLVVTPADVCKIRLQAQTTNKQQSNGFIQMASKIVREEGVGALYKGVVPTIFRQGCNQAVNFTFYSMFKQHLMEYKVNKYGATSPKSELQPWEVMMCGGLSAGLGPMVNNPLDVVKTRLQKQKIVEGQSPKYTGFTQATALIAREEGVLALWKGLSPRLMRIIPGQAITFMTYEAVTSRIQQVESHFTNSNMSIPAILSSSRQQL